MPQVGTSLKGAELKRKLIELASTSRPDKPLDIYVTSSTGHQIREDGGSGVTDWRYDRDQKLKTQFTSTGPVVGIKRKAGEMVSGTDGALKPATASNNMTEGSKGTTQATSAVSGSETPKPKQIFKNCTIYINGNTSLSGVSDVELKRLLTSHGAVVSYHLARRQVTHIILTNPSAASPISSGARPSGSTGLNGLNQSSKAADTPRSAILASRKIELEMKGRVKSKIHYVSVEWALSSMKQEKRLAETKFPVVPLREARQGTLVDCKKARPSQKSLMDMMKK
ncbi:hypothetical protein TWF730_005134 [Orbilia blumenaviensis]|uniref:BRCT domain-containing protein n=1 Tax=Orbilia blumenaviensis TaxID=1796055 RepID=A0AAV9VHE1_9PEZI